METTFSPSRTSTTSISRVRSDLDGILVETRVLTRLLLVLAGACEGSIACSTCHIVLSQEQYDALPEPSDEENDMLDLAFGLTDT